MSIQYTIEEWLKFVGLVISTIMAILVASKQFRAWVKRKYLKRQFYLKSRDEMPVILKSIKEKVDTMDEKLRKVESEISPNGGGSMKDALRIVKAEIEASNWLSPRPSFRTTSSGINTFVNEAYCHLCGVTSDELLRLGWKNFAENEDQADDFMERWLLASKEFSQFSGKLKIKNSRNEYKGEWLIKIRPLGPLDSNKNEYLWHGSLYPFDSVAIAYATKYNIPLN